MESETPAVLNEFYFPLIWRLGVSIYVDKMKYGFQGRHKYKHGITYKAEGYGFQANDLCQYGFCYQFFFYNDPAPQKYIKMVISSLHARKMENFDHVYDEYHQYVMENLYNSYVIFRAAYNQKF